MQSTLTLNAVFEALDALFVSCQQDEMLLKNAELNADWFADYANQRIVNSFLFNYIKIQDKLGAKLFRQLLLALREIDDASMPMIDILNRLEKLKIIDSVEQWDRLREIRNAITHEYPLDIDERLENIALALGGFNQLRQLYSKLKAYSAAKF
jgi:hypothetical protein